MVLDRLSHAGTRGSLSGHPSERLRLTLVIVLLLCNGRTHVHRVNESDLECKRILQAFQFVSHITRHQFLLYCVSSIVFFTLLCDFIQEVSDLLQIGEEGLVLVEFGILCILEYFCQLSQIRLDLSDNFEICRHPLQEVSELLPSLA